MKKDHFRSVLILGGAGFVGCNLARELLADSDSRVHIFDNLSRPGARHNLAWLQQSARNSGRLQITVGDVRDAAMVERAVRHATEIYHFAAQVAVTTSIADPRLDFEVNVVGTFNVLEAARKWGHRPFLLFTSTNKVYGEMPHYQLRAGKSRYEYAALQAVPETEPLDFHSPYGCSKGAADQYVRDYARMFGIPTVVFRMSCIAGDRQFGTEDQGWVAHFTYSALERRPLTVYGDGRQVRDVLNVRDLVQAFQAARSASERTVGQIYNVGGGPSQSVSLVEVIGQIERLTGRQVQIQFEDARPGDQLVYIANTQKLQTDTGWRPRCSVLETLDDIRQFWKHNRELLADFRRIPEPESAPLPAAPLLEGLERMAG